MEQRELTSPLVQYCYAFKSFVLTRQQNLMKEFNDRVKNPMTLVFKQHHWKSSNCTEITFLVMCETDSEFTVLSRAQLKKKQG